jgi:hypothetical protein
MFRQTVARSLDFFTPAAITDVGRGRPASGIDRGTRNVPIDVNVVDGVAYVLGIGTVGYGNKRQHEIDDGEAFHRHRGNLPRVPIKQKDSFEKPSFSMV